MLRMCLEIGFERFRRPRDPLPDLRRVDCGWPDAREAEVRLYEPRSVFEDPRFFVQVAREVGGAGDPFVGHPIESRADFEQPGGGFECAFSNEVLGKLDVRARN
jgi:hypothetical protein